MLMADKLMKQVIPPLSIEEAIYKSVVENWKAEGLYEQTLHELKHAGRRVPIFLWTDYAEDSAIAQFRKLAMLPFVFHHLAGMPDIHTGYAMPIGGVMATIDVIIPYAVGYDIGCGMCFIRTNLEELTPKQLTDILSLIRQAVPVGDAHHNKEQDWHLVGDLKEPIPIVHDEYRSALKQLGTLGSGNHFIEIQKGDDGYIGIMIHSGSRNVGWKVCDYYYKTAMTLCEKWKIELPDAKIAYLPVDSDAGQSYIMEMNWCVNFALANRKLMMERIMDAFKYVIDDPNLTFEPMINIAHNYAELENHYKRNVWVHRKGATLAREGTIGIIPGSQGSKSYIVKGKGNPESFMSCSHGAGRMMGRGQATRDLDLATEIKKLEDQGILHSIRNVDDLDEATGAYKDIDVVMKNQEDLVDIITELRPLAVIKGKSKRKRRKKKNAEEQSERSE